MDMFLGQFPKIGRGPKLSTSLVDGRAQLNRWNGHKLRGE
jgi:hypothetical protein